MEPWQKPLRALHTMSCKFILFHLVSVAVSFHTEKNTRKVEMAQWPDLIFEQLFLCSTSFSLFASRGNTGPCPPDREQQLLWTWHWHELCSDKEIVLVISQAPSIHSFLSHLGPDIYCIIARTLTEREAAPLTQQMRRSSWNVLAQLLMSKRARNGGCTFLTINTHFVID